MPHGNYVTHAVRHVIFNCFQNGMSPETIFKNCFNSDVGSISLNTLQKLHRMHINPDKAEEKDSYLGLSKKRGRPEENHDAFDAVVEHIVRKFTGMPHCFLLMQIQPYMPNETASVSRGYV